MRGFIALLLVAVAYASPVLRAREPIQDSYIVKLQNDVDLDDFISTVRLAGGKLGSVYRKVFKGFAVELSSKVLDLVSNLSQL
ncbi:proteinase R-like [Strongylocentrotus purpuratus]|uniref:Inhibitor I9 domain-containing protein n=1 Tax=Strongylocentrotus purpuratus TaxID=7668 RepID=A0A7M7T0Y8_STRPU|nr:proteinase R-like [Strongylocentrotus purpuratus]